MFSKVRVTEVVPAPDEPVIVMMGCWADMGASRKEMGKSGGTELQAPAAYKPRLPNRGES